jgi:hypothetical protein
MQRKYAKDGVVALSVSLDDPADKEVDARILKFLRAKDADFTNLRLDELSELWSERLKIDIPPAVFVFDREGRLAGKFELEKANYEKYVEPLVDQLLKK